MYLVSNYTKEEMLRVVAEHAKTNLPPDSKNGIIRASQKEDGSIEVFFIEHQSDIDFSAEN